MAEKLVKGKFLITVLGMLILFALAMSGKLDSTQAGLSLVAIVGGFLHFDSKAAA